MKLYIHDLTEQVGPESDCKRIQRRISNEEKIGILRLYKSYLP